MAFPIRNLVLDPTGTSPANFIQNEKHVLGVSRGPFHAIAPFYGPFYNDARTWVVRRNGVLQKYGVDYFGVVMCSDETMVFAGEIDEIVLFKGGSPGDVIEMDLQYLGGPYQNYAKGLEDLWQAFINDKRPIDWINVLGRPISYNPSYHLHMIEDVVGWQPVIIALERMTNAITLRNIPAFEMLINWVLARMPDQVTVEEIDNMLSVDKMVTFNRLLYAARVLNFNAITFRPENSVVKVGGMARLNISSTNFPRHQLLYWDIQNVTSESGMFLVNRGVTAVEDNEGFFYVSTNPNYQGQNEVTFRVNLRRQSATGPILCESKPITLQFNPVWKSDYGILQNGLWDYLGTNRSILAAPSAEANFLIPGDHFWKGAAQT